MLQNIFVLSFQDAKKGMLFIDFPPVLQLQLKRFEYDFVRDTMVKVWNSLYIFSGLFLDFIYDLSFSSWRLLIFNIGYKRTFHNVVSHIKDMEN